MVGRIDPRQKGRSHTSFITWPQYSHAAIVATSYCYTGWEGLDKNKNAQVGTTGTFLEAGYDSHGEVSGLYSKRDGKSLKWYL